MYVLMQAFFIKYICINIHIFVCKFRSFKIVYLYLYIFEERITEIFNEYEKKIMRIYDQYSSNSNIQIL